MPEFISVENVRISLLPATLVRRFGAILIDIISVFTVIMIGGTTFGMLISSWERIWLPVAVLVLLLLPAIEEVIFDGRTLGKLCLGLRVVQIDGSAPTVWALLLRYFLLWVDVFGSFGTGLLLMFGTKLHRRWGDMAPPARLWRNATGKTVRVPRSVLLPIGPTTPAPLRTSTASMPAVPHSSRVRWALPACTPAHSRPTILHSGSKPWWVGACPRKTSCTISPQCSTPALRLSPRRLIFGSTSRLRVAPP